MNTTESLKLAIVKAGSMSRLARFCGVTPQAVYSWLKRGKVPIQRCKDVSKATGISVKKLRPDFF